MIRTIKLYQARALINRRNVDSLIYVDQVSVEGCMNIILKSDLSDQLYSFYYYFYSDSSNSGLATNTTKQFGTFLDNDKNKNLDVEVAPVKKVTKQITVTKYVGDDSND